MNRNSLCPQAPQFQFIPVQPLGQATNPTSRRLVRSHALKESLKAKRKNAERLHENFRVIAPHQSRSRFGANDPPATLAVDRLDPFDTLPVDSSRLQIFLRHETSRQAGEPIFSLEPENWFQSLRDILKISLDNPALINALMLTLAFAVNGFTANAECLVYKGKAISYLNEKIKSSKTAATEPTICAILLLVGVESRLGRKLNVQIHMNGIRKLLELCESQYVQLSAATKRAIFWQDLNSAVMTRSERIISHETFRELAWSRASSYNPLYVLPKGFLPISHLFGDETKAIFEDIHALQCVWNLDSHGSLDTLQLDNHQAWIESRIYETRVKLSTSDDLLDCCLLNAYLCAYLMYTDVWQGSLIPEHCSSQLLRKLQQMTSVSKWSGKENLLLWFVCMGGAFARGVVRSEYSVLINSAYLDSLLPLTSTWESVESCLKLFFWSEKTYREPCRAYWIESCSS